ncbi:long-chain-fatty-acid--CoA ligase [Kineosporia sp. A_224]|uniref:long-chain-fatty-acid--CoA ligase n=1 Tax=Kineosporia sp. A_224 TaxID=1962180 RepID=UPI000B4BFD65|nr:long-chain-fatty-acid--CoA ligase [Kineosporia sp. A_224]
MTTSDAIATPRPGPRPRLVSDIVRHWATTTPDAEAVAYEGTTWTWAQWDDRARRVSGALAAAGIGRGDRVAFVDKNHPACLEVTLGASAVGAANAVVNWRLAPDELVYVLGDAAPRLLFVGADLVPAWEAVHERLPGITTVVVVGGEQDTYEAFLAAATPADAAPDVEPDDTALVLYTSGTTGFPKGATLTHRGLVAHTVALRSDFPMGPGDRNLVAMPLFHVGGSCYALVGFDAGVPTTVLREVTGPGLVGSFLGGCTHAFLVPAVIAGLVQAGAPALGALARLKILGYGASPAPLPVLRAAMEACPATDFLQVYGMTELSGVVTTLKPAAHRDAARPERLASAGTPIPGVELRVVDPATGEDVPPGTPGELWWRTEQRMGGYLNKPEATAETITPDGYVRSGDVGRVDDGGFVFIEDRVKDMIITGGENVYGPEVERVLVEHPSIAEAVVVGVPDDVWGEAVKAIVVPAEGHTVDAAQVVAYAREHLAGYKCPRSVDVVEAFPRNATGKILKNVLRRPYWEGTGRSI